MTENFSEVVEAYLQPHVYALTSYIQDSIHFLIALEQIHILAIAWLITIDFETLFSSIHHDPGIQVVGEFVKTQKQGQWSFNKFITQALNFMLQNNIFMVNDQYYLQIQGVAIATPCTPSYSNLFLGWWGQLLMADDASSMYLGHLCTTYLCGTGTLMPCLSSGMDLLIYLGNFSKKYAGTISISPSQFLLARKVSHFLMWK